VNVLADPRLETKQPEQKPISTSEADVLPNGPSVVTAGWLDHQPTESPRYKAISLQAVDKVAEKHPSLKPHLYDVKLA